MALTNLEDFLLINDACTVFTRWANCIYCFFFVDSYVLECSYCGVIYRSRQHWYGNVDPEKTVVRTEIRHVWADVGSSVAFRQQLIEFVFDDVARLSVSSVVVMLNKSTTTLQYTTFRWC